MKVLPKIAIFSLYLFSLSFSGTLLDRRDGRTYATVKIGDLEWMAENLSYVTEYSECYDDSPENCAMYGYLYIWSEAKKVCPDGWHLPTKRDFRSLANAADDAGLSGKILKSVSKWNGSNELGFSAVPGGYGFYSVKLDSTYYIEKGTSAVFWGSEKMGRDSTCLMLKTGSPVAGWGSSAFFERDSMFVYLFSVRCVKNKTEVAERYEPPTNYQEETVSAKPTAICRDGSPSYSQSRSGTCAGHGGVEKWMDFEEKKNAQQKSNVVEKRYEQPTYYQEEYSPPQSQPTVICADGKPSYSQGRGTCSHHGGVKEKTNSEKKQKSNQNDFGVGNLLNLFF